jgi:hypothetical protein
MFLKINITNHFGIYLLPIILAIAKRKHRYKYHKQTHQKKTIEEQLKLDNPYIICICLQFMKVANKTHATPFKVIYS